MNLLERVRVVLIETTQPGNIGSSARAMKTMGLDRLHLVTPRLFPHEEATALAAGATDVLDGARRHDVLDTAIADCRLLIGASARRRGVALPELSPREAAARLIEAARDGVEVGLLFGTERTGLSNEELQRCHACVRIPANPDYSSLNLSQAVQVLAYELRLAMLSAAGTAKADPDVEPRERPATSAELEGFFRHLDEALHAIDFHKGKDGTTVTRRLRRLFLRAQMSEREVAILHGVLADAERMARLASRGS
jgi:tRNA (cytidine32/uridine32-2'-O)-methyltransferase